MIGYYIVIPVHVLFDRSICAEAKLLYGQITSLSTTKGFCWATNSYFSELYGVHQNSISKWINSLVEAGHITSDVVRDDSGTRRYLKITGSSEPRGGYPPACEGWVTQASEYNNINTDNYNNIISKGKNLFSKEISISNKKKKVEPYANMSDLEIQKFDRDILPWIQKTCPSVLEMKEPLLPCEFMDLLKNHPKEDVKNVLKSMHNKVGLISKYKSAFLTAEQWIENAKERKTNTGATNGNLLTDNTKLAAPK